MATVVSYDQAAIELGIKSTDSRKRRDSVVSRMVALGYTAYCSRCGGSGHYSYNQMHGTRCYGCDGRGETVKPLTRQLLDEMVRRQTAGELDEYFARNRANAEARRMIAPLMAALDHEWAKGAVHQSYKAYGKLASDRDWVRPCPLDMQPEYRAASLINDAWELAIKADRDSTLTGIERKERIEEALSWVRAINAAWAVFEHDNRVT